MRIVILHDYSCPLGDNGRAAFVEAADALADTPPEARATIEDRKALAEAWRDLREKQVCNCGAEAEIKRREMGARREQPRAEA
jgi:hypothetical protein